MQRFQKKVLLGILNALRYIRNKYIHRDIKVKTLLMKSGDFCQPWKRLHEHETLKAIDLLDNSALVRCSVSAVDMLLCVPLCVKETKLILEVIDG